MTKKKLFFRGIIFSYEVFEKIATKYDRIKTLEKKERLVYRMSNDTDNGNKNFEESHCIRNA